MFGFKYIVCLVLFCSVKSAVGNPGRLFLVAFPQNFKRNPVDNVQIVLTSASTAEVDVNLQFNTPSWFQIPNVLSFKLQPEGRHTVQISGTIRMPIGILKDFRSLTITSNGDIVVFVNNKQSSNGDGYLAMPVSEFGREFYSVNYKIMKNIAASFVVVAATTNDTVVKICLPRSTSINQFRFNNRDYVAGDTMEVNLAENEVFQLQLAADLTGSHIVSSKPVLVLSGVNRTTLHYDKCLSHVLDLMPPVDKLSKNYVTVSYPKHQRLDVYRFVATEANTSVTIGTQETVNLQYPGDFYEFLVQPNNYFWIDANKPILAAQLTATGPVSGKQFGDPALLVMTPIEAKRDNYAFSIGSAAASNNELFLTIVIDKNETSGLRLDGSSITTTWFSVTGNSSLVVGEVKVQGLTSFHKVRHTDGVGFLAYIQFGVKCEGTTFALGYQATVLNQPCDMPASIPGDNIDNDCDGKVDEESCCSDQLMDKDGDGRYNEDCSAPPGYRNGDPLCCEENTYSHVCNAESRSFLCKSEEKFQYSSDMSPINVDKILNCQLECIIEFGCWGYNYYTSNNTCYLISGYSTGTDYIPGWKFYRVKTNP